MEHISTAPRDGTAILIRCDDHYDAEHGWVIAFWSDGDTGAGTTGKAGWYRSEADSDGHRLFQHGGVPLGWLPLPPLEQKEPVVYDDRFRIVAYDPSGREPPIIQRRRVK